MMSLKSRETTSFPKATELTNKKSGQNNLTTPSKVLSTVLLLHFDLKYLAEYGKKILLILKKSWRDYYLIDSSIHDFTD